MKYICTNEFMKHSINNLPKIATIFNYEKQILPNKRFEKFLQQNIKSRKQGP